MQTLPRTWSWGVGKIEVNERAIKFDAPGRHESVALATITGVERKGLWPMVTLTIKHAGGTLEIKSLTPVTATEIVEALGF